MPGFFSPLTDPSGWSLSFAGTTGIPAPLRYHGFPLLGVRAQQTGGALSMPALGILRKQLIGATTAVEIQVNPFPLRRIATAFPFGLPTFYLLLPDATGLIPFTDGDTASGGTSLGVADDVTIVMAGQDRIALHPATWAAQIAATITAGGGDASPWSPFAAVVGAALVSAGEPPVVLLDHAGRTLTSGTVHLLDGATDMAVSLAIDDGGDLQRAIARRHTADPIAMPRSNVFQGAISIDIVLDPATADHQFVRVEDGTTGHGRITVPSSGGHIAVTDLHTWFAPQFATPTTGRSLVRYSHGNALTTFVNGPEFFDDFFRRLQEAQTPNGGVHLTGWAMFQDAVLTTLTSADPAAVPTTLHQAAQLIAAAQGPNDVGGSRFLPALFYPLEPADMVSLAEILAVDVVIMGLLIASKAGADVVHSDAAGAIVLIGIMFANAIIISSLLASGGRPIEPNKAAVDVLDPLPATEAKLSPYPAEIADNPVAPSTGEFPFSTLVTVDRHFGIYHQKLAIIKRANDFVGYCGGVDLNPDRLDDARHLNPRPFHDVHARFQGPAVADLALSFEQRWTRDGGGGQLAFATPDATALGTPGANVVQVARTYFRAAGPTRALEFAPQGDRTLNDTMLQGIAAAKEFIYIEDQYFTPPASYRAALTAKVASGDIKSLMVSVPGITDQPFGEIIRSGLISDLMAADAGRGIVRIGYPRRHYTLPDNDLRASSGRCLLMEDLASGGGVSSTVVLGPKTRLPSPPFWLAIEGELMYVDDEAATGSAGPAPTGGRRYAVVRGDSTRLIHGGPTPQGAKPRAHLTGAAATVVDLANIYVHAKLMIVDDVFLSLGSANLNRRGLFHDGEINTFTVPEQLKSNRANPVRALRRRLWAEVLDLPEPLAGPLVDDPIAAAALFDRSPLLGNRFTDITAYPEHVMFGLNGGDGIVSTVLQLAVGVPLIAVDHQKLFDGLVDPTSALEGP